MLAIRMVLCCLLVALSPLAASDELSARVDKLFAAWDKADTPGAALAVVRDGQIIYRRAYGLAHLEYGVRNTPATVFHAASVSKQFTAFAIQLLVQDGKISLDDEVRKFLPELQVQGPPITIRHLLHHTSGLRDQWDLLRLSGRRLDDVITEDDILLLLWQQKQLNFAPGEEHLYSNSGYTLLALIVKRVSGQTLAAFAQTRIFGPLGMTSTHFHEDYGTLLPGRAYSYRRIGGVYRYVALSYSNVGATSLFTTVEDLARWDANAYSAKVGGAAVQAAMLLRGRLNGGREINYASGLFHGRHRGLPTVGHDGVDAGYRAQVLRFPEQRFTVLLLGNAADMNTNELARRVADIYLEAQLQPERPPSVAAQDQLDARAPLPQLDGGAQALRACTGEYYSEELHTLYRLSLLDGKLMLLHPRGAMELKPASRDSFSSAAFPEGSINLRRNPANECTGFAVSTRRVRNLEFQRVTLVPAPSLPH